MRGTCRHGNPLGCSCAFCKAEGRAGRDDPPGRFIPRGSQSPLPKLRCPNCNYTTPYRDALRRHKCRAQPRADETAQRLIDSLSPIEKRGGFMSWLSGLWRRPERPSREYAPPPEPTPLATRTIQKETRLAMAEDYIALLCGRLGVRTPFLVLSDEMDNPGACGEAGRVMIRLQRQATLTREWSAVQATIRHEVAHIVVHNTPGMGEAPAHGVEFDAAMERVERIK